MAAVEEDLRLARDVVGLARADGVKLAATMSLLDPTRTVTAEVLLAEARDVLAAHTVRACRLFAQQHVHDPGAVAAATSLRDILLQGVDANEMAGTLRRRAIREQAATTNEGALRKRENGILKLIAASAHEDLLARRQRGGPQTPEQVVMLMAPLVKELHEIIHNVMQRMYPYETAYVSDDIGDLTSAMIYMTAEVQWYARVLWVVTQRPQSSVPSDMVFPSLASLFLTVPFGSEADRRTITDLYAKHPRPELWEFTNELRSINNGELETRCMTWFYSCYANCAYERTRNWHMMCEAHLFTTFLKFFYEAAEEQASGELAADFAEDFGPLLIPEFLRANP